MDGSLLTFLFTDRRPHGDGGTCGKGTTSRGIGRPLRIVLNFPWHPSVSLSLSHLLSLLLYLSLLSLLLLPQAKKVIIASVHDPLRSADVSDVAKQFGESLQQALLALRIPPAAPSEVESAVRMLDHLGEASRQLGVLCTGRCVCVCVCVCLFTCLSAGRKPHLWRRGRRRSPILQFSSTPRCAHCPLRTQSKYRFHSDIGVTLRRWRHIPHPIARSAKLRGGTPLSSRRPQHTTLRCEGVRAHGRSAGSDGGFTVPRTGPRPLPQRPRGER